MKKVFEIEEVRETGIFAVGFWIGYSLMKNRKVIQSKIKGMLEK